MESRVPNSPFLFLVEIEVKEERWVLFGKKAETTNTTCPQTVVLFVLRLLV